MYGSPMYDSFLQVPTYKKAPNGIDLQYHPGTKQLASQLMQNPARFKGMFSGIGLAQKDLAGGIPIRVVKNKFGDEIEVYGTFRLNFHHFDRFELDLRGHMHVRGAALSCLRLKWADIVLI